MVRFNNGKVSYPIMAIILALSMMFVSPASQASAADVMPYVTNVGNRSFTVSWITSSDMTGQVNYGKSPDSLSSTAYDDRGQATADDTHQVTITNLTASTPYYYEIVAGGVTYNNSGVPYQVTTGPGLDFKMPDPVTGMVNKADGATAAEGAIVYVNIGTSQVLSALVDSSGNWGLDIAPIKTANYQSYYTHSDNDDISIEVKGSADGTASRVVTIAAVKAGMPAMILTLTALPGDVDGDGNLTATDVTKMERIISSLDSPTPGADVNQDGKLNAMDITKVERIVAGTD